MTIARHLRDMVVTEYGIADLRGKTDAGAIEALLNISDSRFQSGLIEQAQRAGKLPKDFRLDARFADNRPSACRLCKRGTRRCSRACLWVAISLGSSASCCAR